MLSEQPRRTLNLLVALPHYATAASIPVSVQTTTFMLGLAWPGGVSGP